MPNRRNMESDTSLLLQHHKLLLQSLCRICGSKINGGNRMRKPKEVKLYADQMKRLGIFIENDLDEIHPKYVCEKCRKMITNMERSANQQKDYKPNINLFIFKPHVDQSCKVCCDSFKSKVGRRPVLKQVNQYTNESNTICETKQPTNNDSSSKVVELEHFEPPSLKSFAEQLGYAFIQSNNLTTFTILTTRNAPFLQIRNLLTISVSTDQTWCISVDDTDISKNVLFNSFASILTESSCKCLLKLCTQLKFCSGNEDFNELCNSRREEGNRVVFQDKGNSTIAREVNDVVCMALQLEKGTIRHKNCALVVTNNSPRCDACMKYRLTLVALNWKLKRGKLPLSKRKIEPSSSSSIPHRYMNSEQLSDKLNQQKEDNRTLKNKNAVLKKRLQELINEKGISVEDSLSSTLTSTLTDENISNTLSEGSAMKLLFEEQMKQSALKNSKQMRWHPLIIRWCLGIYHSSPSVYEFLKRSSFLKLPHKSTLLDYSIYTNPHAGFNPDVLRKLYEEANVQSLEDHSKNVSILFDEMKIKSELVYNKSSGKLIGFVELDSVTNEIDRLERTCSENSKGRDIATHVLAFMVRGIYSKLLFTFAYFPTTSISCDRIFPMAWNASQSV